ncbi:hypothetical protein WA852_32045, partial [Pseudomonas aeruginosa]
MNPQKHSASVAEEQMLAHFRAHAPQQPAPALDQAIRHPQHQPVHRAVQEQPGYPP